LPKRWGFLEVSGSNVLTTILKPAKDGSTVVRLYESSGKPAQGVKIKMRGKVISAEESNLIEDAGRKIQIANDTIQLDLRGFEIKTLKLKLQPMQ